MNLRYKTALAILDFWMVLLGLLLALGLRLDFNPILMERFLTVSHCWFYAGVSLIAVICFYLYGLYEKVWRYASIHEAVIMIYAVLTVFLAFSGFVLTSAGLLFPRTGPAIAAILWLFFCGGLRFMLRLASLKKGFEPGAAQCLIVGANDVGEVIARDLLRERTSHKPIGFVDSDIAGKKVTIHGLPVLGAIEDIPKIVNEYKIDEIILASSLPKILREVVSACASTEVKFRMVPSISDVVEGTVTVNKLRQVQIEDLLERDPVNTDVEKTSAYIKDRVVLVTGAGGSIGSEICRQVLSLGAKQLILMGRGENSIYEIGIELKSPKTVSYICSLRDESRMRMLFETYHPEVVFHTAAHKHVPLMEQNPAEAVTNNVFGSFLLLNLAKEYHVQKMVFISTDKAVNPTNVMGTTKRVAELLLASRKVPGFAAVRFGNVLNSRGSVIPTFKNQISNGGPVTVTHPEMTRFFMTIPEAVSLVLQAGALAKGGEIYILDMGKPVKIIDLARNLIRLSGLEPDVDIPIKVTGLRPGEKLYEELTNKGEETEATEIAKINRVTSKPPEPNWPGDEKISELRNAAFSANDKECIRILKELVPNYTSEDWPD